MQSTPDRFIAEHRFRAAEDPSLARRRLMDDWAAADEHERANGRLCRPRPDACWPPSGRAALARSNLADGSGTSKGSCAPAFTARLLAALARTHKLGRGPRPVRRSVWCVPGSPGRARRAGARWGPRYLKRRLRGRSEQTGKWDATPENLPSAA